MSESAAIGKIGWIDMTVDDAPCVRDFYKTVVGWETDDVDMGGYSDYVMKMPVSGDGVAGVCHSRGSNADLPVVSSASSKIPAARSRGSINRNRPSIRANDKVPFNDVP